MLIEDRVVMIVRERNGFYFFMFIGNIYYLLICRWFNMNEERVFRINNKNFLFLV